MISTGRLLRVARLAPDILPLALGEVLAEVRARAGELRREGEHPVGARSGGMP